MNLADLKNLDVKDLIEKIKSGSGPSLLKDKKALTKFAIGFVAVLIFLIFYYSFVAPKVNAQKEKINIMKDNQNKIVEYTSNIGNLEARVQELQPKYEKSSKLFHSRKELEDLYQVITNFAMTNGLTIINLSKGQPRAVGAGANNTTNNTEQNQDSSQESKGSNAQYYKIPVNYKIQGNYLGFLKFRRALSKSAKVINFDKETIKVEKDGSIVSEGTISIVGLPNEYGN
jgi:Tfp pilus assembly protein PilO